MRLGDTALCYKAVNREGTPRWGGPAKILDIGEAGGTVKFQAQTFKAARYCVSTEAEEKDVEGVGWGPTASQLASLETAPGGDNP